MPTIPQGQSPPSRTESHQARQVAESFGADAERYDRARPRYPDALVERIVAASPGPDVLDVGCGTGIAARQFQAAGCTVLGVDPDARMAEFSRRTGVDAEVATFEAWDPAGRAFDAVVAGQAWHWVDPVAGAAKAAQVLRPGGRLAVFGHVFGAPPDVAEALTAVYRRVAPDSPFNAQPTAGALPTRTALDLYQAMFAKAADGIRQAGGFGEPEQWRFDWEHSYTRAEWLDLLPTTGTLNQLPPDKLAEVLDGVGGAIDKIGGSFTMPYITLAATAARSSATLPSLSGYPLGAGRRPGRACPHLQGFQARRLGLREGIVAALAEHGPAHELRPRPVGPRRGSHPGRVAWRPGRDLQVHRVGHLPADQGGVPGVGTAPAR